jgi:hypothetical protein
VDASSLEDREACQELKLRLSGITSLMRLNNFGAINQKEVCRLITAVNPENSNAKVCLSPKRIVSATF